jgi:3-oxoacyl-[acyl-carrier-protein] synthase II
MTAAAAVIGMAAVGLPDSWPVDLGVPRVALLEGRGVNAIDRESLLFASAGLSAAERAAVDGGSDVGVVCGTCAAGELQYRRILAALQHPASSIKPSWGPRSSFNAPAAELSIRCGARGPTLTVTSGEAAGLDAIFMARDVIAAGEARVMIAGGVDEFDGAGGAAAVLVLVDATAACGLVARVEGAASVLASATRSQSFLSDALTEAICRALAEANRDAREVRATILAPTRAPLSRDVLAGALAGVQGLGAPWLALDDLSSPVGGAGGALGALLGVRAALRGDLAVVAALESDGRALALVVGGAER